MAKFRPYRNGKSLPAVNMRGKALARAQAAQRGAAKRLGLEVWTDGRGDQRVGTVAQRESFERRSRASRKRQATRGKKSGRFVAKPYYSQIRPSARGNDILTERWRLKPYKIETESGAADWITKVLYPLSKALEADGRRVPTTNDPLTWTIHLKVKISVGGVVTDADPITVRFQKGYGAAIVSELGARLWDTAAPMLPPLAQPGPMPRSARYLQDGETNTDSPSDIGDISLGSAWVYTAPNGDLSRLSDIDWIEIQGYLQRSVKL